MSNQNHPAKPKRLSLPDWNGYSAAVYLSQITLLGLTIFEVCHPHFQPPKAEVIITPLILGCASLIVSLGSRNASISERARNNSKSLLEGQIEARAQNLKDQNQIFKERYIFNQFALSFQFIALILFLAMAIFSASAQSPAVHICFFFGLAFLVSGFCLTFFDIYRSQETLFMEIDYAAENGKTNEGEQGAAGQLPLAAPPQSSPEISMPPPASTSATASGGASA